MKVDMNLLKQLRDATMASLTECKNALVKAEGDLEEAKKILKERGAAKAAKKAERETNEGAVKVESDGSRVVAIKLFCETDFVAKNELFDELLNKLMSILKDTDEDADSLGQLSDETKERMQSVIHEYVIKLGENIQLGDVIIKKGNAHVYNHFGSKISAIVFYEGDEDVVKEVALQIAAMSPEFLTRDDMPAGAMKELKEVAQKQLEESGKPADIIEKIIDGKVSKALEEVVLMEQAYIRDGSKKIKDILKGTEIKSFIRFAVA